MSYPDLSNAAREPSPTLRENPYPGLRPFQIEDAPYFFGRSAAIAELEERIKGEKVVVLVGNSGTGKSSLLRAGLMHQLQASEINQEIKLLQPGEKPLESLLLTLLSSPLTTAEKNRQLAQFKPLLHQGKAEFYTILERSFSSPLVLLVDQFEEIFSLCQNELERQTFLDCLLGDGKNTEQNNKLSVAIALRSDFLPNCLALNHPGLNYYLQHNLMLLSNLDAESLKEAIVEPAKLVDFSLPTGLINVLIEDTLKCANTLPLLQYTLLQLWQDSKNQGIKLSDYRALGGVANCLDQRANLTYQNLTEFEQETVKHILLNLIPSPPLGEKPKVRSLINRDLVTPNYGLAAINLAVKKMTKEQLLVTEAIPLATGLEPPVMVYLPQQCIIEEWRLLQQWLRQRDRHLGQKQQLEEAALIWQNSALKDQKQYLLTGQNLKEAIKIQAQDRQGKSSFDSTPLSQVAEVFIQASLRSRQSDRLKLTALIAFIPLILLITLSFYLYRQSQFQGYWNVVKENQDQRESQPRIKALQTLNQMGESLSNQNFNQINLQNINLSKANLSNSSFVESFLTGANLKSANLSKANLSQTELTGANLTGADLSQGKLVNSYLTGANLTQANLTGANLTQANLMRSNFNQANLESANLNKAELTGANLTQTNLQKSRFQKANLWGVDLSSANLENADFSLANLTRVNFSGVKLKGIKLKEANLTNADFSTASVLPLTEIKTACFWQTATFTEEIKQQLMALKTAFSPNCQASK